MGQVESTPYHAARFSRALVCGAFPAVLFVVACSAGSGKGLPGGSGTGASGSQTVGGTGGSAATNTLTVSLGNHDGGSNAGAGGADSCKHELVAVVRDFKNNHPDFTTFMGDDIGIVKHYLGADGKPVYAGNPTTTTTSGQANFDQWYRDVSTINESFPITLPLASAGNGIYSYDSAEYFPIDGLGFGNENSGHNFSFTTEIHTQFLYKGGEVFTFTGDDDVFVYINKRLVINLGGVHNPETAPVLLDAVASQVGITVGTSYLLDMFGAERHPSGSHFRVDTTIECFVPPPPPM